MSGFERGGRDVGRYKGRDLGSVGGMILGLVDEWKAFSRVTSGMPAAPMA